MIYKYVHITEIGRDKEPDPERLKRQIVYSFAEKLMELVSVERIEERGLIRHEAKIAFLHETQLKEIISMLNLASTPATNHILMAIKREIIEM